MGLSEKGNKIIEISQYFYNDVQKAIKNNKDYDSKYYKYAYLSVVKPDGYRMYIKYEFGTKSLLIGNNITITPDTITYVNYDEQWDYSLSVSEDEIKSTYHFGSEVESNYKDFDEEIVLEEVNNAIYKLLHLFNIYYDVSMTHYDDNVKDDLINVIREYDYAYAKELIKDRTSYVFDSVHELVGIITRKLRSAYRKQLKEINCLHLYDNNAVTKFHILLTNKIMNSFGPNNTCIYVSDLVNSTLVESNLDFVDLDISQFRVSASTIEENGVIDDWKDDWIVVHRQDYALPPEKAAIMHRVISSREEYIKSSYDDLVHVMMNK